MAIKYPTVLATAAPPRAMMQGMMRSRAGAEREEFLLSAAERRDRTVEHLRANGLWEQLSPRELPVVEATLITLSAQQQIDATWWLEGAVVLMWALNKLPELLPYGVLAKPELLKQIPTKEVDPFAQSAALRPRAEIDRVRNLAELWHWRSRTRQIIERGDQFPDTSSMKAAGFRSYEDVIRQAANRGAASGDLPALIEGDFPVNGKAYSDLTGAEWSKVRSQTVERHRALNWLCGHAPGNRWDETPTGT